ncbi:MAG: hypothetical protein HOP31_12990 [Ignavibacteria bacterium]|nr:hypothetical protein [Ignavibacteria bacterium]
MAGIKRGFVLLPGNEIAERLVKALVRRFGTDRSIYEVAKHINEHQGTIKESIEAKNAFRQASVLYKLCNLCGVSVESIITGSYTDCEKKLTEANNKVAELENEIEVLKEKVVEFDKLKVLFRRLK